MANILIIDDDQMICNALCAAIKKMGHEASYALTLHEGLRKLKLSNHDVVFLDVRMPDGNGLSILPEIRLAPDPPEVVVVTAAGDPAGAEIAINSGAWGYVEKPSSIREIVVPLSRALKFREERKSREKHPLTLDREDIIGKSPQTMACLDLVANAAQSHANVLVTGETGTGKELIARVIHNNSLRRINRFVVVDCSSLKETLAESILFGHEKGAFTGAEKCHEGLVKEADGGTLFLDEVGELPPSLQKNFLRVLQEGRFRPLGGKEEEKSDFRLVAATNRNLDQMVRDGLFREDLLFRIRTIGIALSPLRNRPEDIRELAAYYTDRFCKRYDMKAKELSPEFFEALIAYGWPGNVRELRNVIEGLVLTTARLDSMLFPAHLPNHIRIQAAQACLRGASSDLPCEGGLLFSFTPTEDFPTLNDVLGDIKRQYLQALLSHTSGNMEEAGRISGISRSRLYAHLKKHRLPVPKC